MAKLVYLLILLPLVILMPLNGTSFYLGIDAGSIDSFFADGNRVSFDISYRLGDYRFSLPLSYSFCLEHDLSLLDIGLRVDVYPFKNLGLFFGVDLVRYMRFFGLGSPEDRNAFINSIMVGYTFTLPYCFIEPRVIVQDPARMAKGVTELLDDHFPFYYNYYLQIVAGFCI